MQAAAQRVMPMMPVIQDSAEKKHAVVILMTVTSIACIP
jgi:hypothetical protein